MVDESSWEPSELGHARTLSHGEDAADGPDAADLRQGERVGRYRIVKKIGQGGMAVVYRAHDPDLDREVALKLLRTQSDRPADKEQTTRMLREARAVAAVTHENVVAIFDVGLHAGIVYLAMELTPYSLRQWLEAQNRPWRAIVAKFVEAGRGLVAAHAAGLVHRDFKPGNVLIGSDGRARVADFGLAMAVGAAPTRGDSSDAPSDGSGGGDIDMTRLTRTGAVVGTPAFMSPEQFAGKQLDARSDQFSFCVALYRSLYGRVPFVGRHAQQIRASVEHTPPRPPPESSVVPPWVWNVLSRGMARAPDDRWPSMEVLLQQLTPRKDRTRAVMLGAGALGLVGAVALVASGRGDDTCSSGPRALAEVWSPRIASEIGATLHEADSSLADKLWDDTRPELDRYASDWKAAFDEICRGDAAPTLRDVQLACLQGQLDDMRDVVRAAASAESSRLVHAHETTRRLVAPRSCADADYASSRTPLPADPEKRAAVLALRREIEDTVGLREAGHYGEALTDAETHVRSADALGYAPVRARAYLELGRAQLTMAEGREAIASLEVAYFAAAESGQERVQVDAAVELIKVLSVYATDAGQTDRWARQALAAVERLPDPTLRADVIDAAADAMGQRGAWDEALRYRREALDIREANLPADDLRLAESRAGLGRDLVRLGKYEAGVAHLQWALQLQQARLGREHPVVASTLLVLGVAANESGRAGEDEAYYMEALGILEKVYGPDHPKLAPVLQNLANAVIGTDPPRANELGLRALRLQQSVFGPDHPRLAGLHVAIGHGFQALPDLDAAYEHYRRAIELIESADGEASPVLLWSLARVHWARLEFDEAVPLAERVVAALDAEPSDDDIWDAQMRWGAAALRWDAGVDPDEALAEVNRVREFFVTENYAPETASIDRWSSGRSAAGARVGPQP